MENELLVITGATCIAGHMDQYVRNLSSAGIPVQIENVAGAPWLNRGGFFYERLSLHYTWAMKFRHCRRLVITDAFDFFFFGDRYALIEKIPLDHVLHAAEKNCYPDPAIAARIPDRGPWRFFNGGGLAGSPEAIMEMCQSLSSHPLASSPILDQHVMNTLLAENDERIHIDWKTNLFFCLFGGYDELEFVCGKPHNKLHDTFPIFVHANGKWPSEQMVEMYRESLNG